MAVKTVEMVRSIRDRHYEATKDLSFEEQLKFVKDKSSRLQEQVKRRGVSTIAGERKSA